MPFGMLFFIGFLILFLFAALTSAFSMIEIIVATISREASTKRKKYTWIIGGFIFIVGIPSCLSFGVLSDFEIFGKTVFDTMDYAVSNVLMPLGALLISLFVSRKVSKSILVDELQQGSNVGVFFFNLWYYSLKYLTPISIVIVFLDALGVLDWIMNTLV
jgi:NSS family neurotransmitter:Na+ symporter